MCLAWEARAITDVEIVCDYRFTSSLTGGTLQMWSELAVFIAVCLLRVSHYAVFVACSF